MERKASSLVLRYTLAFGLVALGTVATLLIWRWIDPLAFLVYSLAVMAAGWYGGLGPGLFATLLSVLAANYFLFHPQSAWSLDTGSLLRAGLFVLAGGLMSLLDEAQRRARFGEQYERERLAVTLASIGDAVIPTDSEAGFQHHLVRPVDFAALQALLGTLTGDERQEARGEREWSVASCQLSVVGRDGARSARGSKFQVPGSRLTSLGSQP